MQDKEGGTYTPDTREDDDSIGAPRPRNAGGPTEQAPLTLIISGIFLVLLLLLVVIFYNSKLSNNNRLPPELGAEVGNYKDSKVVEAKPIKEDDLLDTLSSTSDSAAPKLAPGAEAPSSVTPSPATASASASSASSQASVANGTQSPAIAAALTPKTTPQPLPPVKVEPAPALKPAAQCKTPPAPKPAPVVAKPVPVTPKPVTPVAVTKPVPTPAPVPAATKPAAAGTYAVQIGAFGSPEIANAQFASAQAAFGSGGASKSVEKVDVKGQTYYRTAFAGFASKDKAAAFCAKIKAAGKTCFVK